MTTKAPKSATEADRTIGGRVAALRVARGLSQTALGEAVGVSFQQVQKYEKGCNRISAGRLRTIADLLKVPVETFFDDREMNGSDGGNARTFYDDPQVKQLVTAFTSIADEITRESVLSIVKAAAKIQPGNTDQARAGSV
jgi:transcriptional regulator with XRE-family HTH domain